MIDRDALTEVFVNSETKSDECRVGMEAEKFAVFQTNQKALQYVGEDGVEGVFTQLNQRFGWLPQSEFAGGPVLSLKRNGASITLEPGAQIELSGAPHRTLHQVGQELAEHLSELSVIAQEFGLSFLHLGFHPFAKQSDLPWVPKLRYPIMKRYLPTKGSRGLDMMRRTATVQVNLDYESESDAFDKIVTLLRLTPVIQALTANSPFREGQVGTLLSERQDVWLNMDPSRSGLLLQLWDKPAPSYRDYVDWALEAGMFLFTRHGKAFHNTGQTFAEFRERGYEGQDATLKDWQSHLGTLFPEVRLKNTIEVRCADALPQELALAVPALLVGVCYDRAALGQARELANQIAPSEAIELQLAVARTGLSHVHRGQTLSELATKLLDIAQGGLERRHKLDAAGNSEAVYLNPLIRLAERGLTPAEETLQRFFASKQSLPQFLLRPLE